MLFTLEREMQEGKFKMTNEKNKIIIQEIYYWKNSRLLPETYCDFLLALYTKGNQEKEEFPLQTIKKNQGFRTFHGLIYGLLLLLLLATLLVIYLTELSYVLQMSIVGFFLVTSISVTAYFIRKRVFFQVPLSLSFIQLLLISLSLVDYFANGDRFWTGAIIVFNCLLWIVMGRMTRVLYLVISGVVGLTIFVLMVIIYNY